MRISSIYITANAYEGTEDRLTILNKDGKYISNEKLIETEKIENLLESVLETVIPELRISDFNINQQLLEEEANKRTEELENDPFFQQFLDKYETQKRLFRDTFRSFDLLEKHLQEYYKHWTRFMNHDYPTFKIEFYLMDGEQITVYSEAQQPFMIPWRIEKDNKKTLTFNNKISQRIEEILPDNFLHKERIKGSSKDLLAVHAYQLRIKFAKKLHDLEFQENYGKQIEKLQTDFTIKNSHIAEIYSLDLDGELGWHAELHNDEWPTNLSVELFLSIENDNIIGLENITETVNNYVETVLSIPWLWNYFRKNPEQMIYLRVANNYSFTAKSKLYIVEESKEHQRKEITQKILEDINLSCFVIITEDSDFYSRWIIFPDKKMLLIHFYGEKVCNWTVNSFPTLNITGHNSAYILLSPEGKIINPN